MKIALCCESCQKKFPSSESIWKCECGGFLCIEFTARFPIEKIKKRKQTLWRYREALPIEQDTSIVSFHEGFTPLIPDEFNGKKVLLKQEYMFPTGSFKDRGASVLVSKLKELGIKNVVEDSSGNAGAAIAAYCAKAHIACDIFVPQKTSSEKLMNITRYGATLHTIPGPREHAAEAAWCAAQTTYYASHYWNPFFFHGTKTFVFELIEQLGWKVPDTIIIPIGNGTLLLGTYLGLKELYHEHVISSLPKLIGVQAENCAPLFKAWKYHQDIYGILQKKQTQAEGIAIATPIRANDILRAIRETNGMMLSVNEQQITDALYQTRQKGFCIEPTSAVAVAGLKKYDKSDEEIVVVPLTGIKKNSDTKKERKKREIVGI